MPVGRPSSFKEEYCEIARKLKLLGADEVRIARILGVSDKTIANWKNQFPQFLQALKDGSDGADFNVANALYEKAIGYEQTITKTDKDGEEYTETIKNPPDTTAAIFWLKNRQKDQWRDVRHNEHKLTTEISEQERIERLSKVLGLEDAPTDRPHPTH